MCSPVEIFPSFAWESLPCMREVSNECFFLPSFMLRSIVVVDSFSRTLFLPHSSLHLILLLNLISSFPFPLLFISRSISFFRSIYSCILRNHFILEFEGERRYDTAKKTLAFRTIHVVILPSHWRGHKAKEGMSRAAEGKIRQIRVQYKLFFKQNGNCK